MILQLDPPIPVDVVGKGHGLAILVIDYGPEHDLLWTTIIDATGEFWTVPNPLVRAQANYSMGRPASGPTVGPGTYLCVAFANDRFWVYSRDDDDESGLSQRVGPPGGFATQDEARGLLDTMRAREPLTAPLER